MAAQVPNDCCWLGRSVPQTQKRLKQQAPVDRVHSGAFLTPIWRTRTVSERRSAASQHWHSLITLHHQLKLLCLLNSCACGSLGKNDALWDLARYFARTCLEQTVLSQCLWHVICSIA